MGPGPSEETTPRVRPSKTSTRRGTRPLDTEGESLGVEDSRRSPGVRPPVGNTSRSPLGETLGGWEVPTS